MKENLFLVAIQGRANESFYQLHLPQIGRQAATAIRACLLQLYKSMGGSSVAEFDCAFTLIGKEIHFVVSVDALDEIGAVLQRELADNICVELFRAADHIGQLRHRGIEPVIRIETANTVRAELGEIDVALYSPQPLKKSLQALVKFLTSMAFHKDGFATVTIGKTTMTVVVAKKPEDKSSPKPEVLNGRIVAANDKAKSCLVRRTDKGRHKKIWLSFTDAQREDVARHYYNRDAVQIEAMIDLKSPDSRNVRGAVISMQLSTTSGSSKDDTLFPKPDEKAPSVRTLVRTASGRRRKK